MSEFLLEIGCEEIPAASLEPAINELRNLLASRLESDRIYFTKIETYFAPRRLVVHIPEIALQQGDLLETMTGPPKAVAFDKDGNPTQAAMAFAKKNNLHVKKLKVVTTPKGEYVGFEKKIKGEKTSKVLSGILPEVIGAISFPKTMYWTADKFRFARPIRWLLAILDRRVVRFEIAGVKSGDKTYGHIVLGRKKFSVRSFNDYQAAMAEGCVRFDHRERRDFIRQQLETTAKHLDGKLFEDELLLNLVTNLNEFPTVIYGRFDDAFLKLPQEVLVTVMREHQKYFSVQNENRNLLPCFLAVTNTKEDTDGVIRRGHERVLKARLADAKFFWETDQKVKLADRVEKLRAVLFQEKLDSYYYDKTERMKAIALKLADALKLNEDRTRKLETAAGLSKADLTTEMVKEFPNLQGVVGGLYARNEGYPEEVCLAIYQHYQPKNIDEVSPSTLEGALISIADKIDTVVGCFSVDLIPSGTKDPFALRRQSNGIVKIILDHELKLSLKGLVDIALEKLTDKIPLAHGLTNLAVHAQEIDNTKKKIANSVLSFFEGRLRYILESRGFKYDEINAVMAAGFDQPYQTLKRIEALARIRPEEDFLAITTAFKRIKNILRHQDISTDGVKAGLLQESAERELYELFQALKPRISDHVNQLDYYSALKLMASMRKAVDQFFDKVLVMAENLELRKNRIHLLNEIASLFTNVADISEIVVEASASQRSEVRGQGSVM